MSYFLAPIGNDQQCDANGNPLSGGKIYTYLAGTSTAAVTYTDSTSGIAQANPIILNSSGIPASPIWLLGGFPLKFVIKDSADVVIRTVDNVSGINDTSSVGEWVESGLTPTYISATSFSVVGDQTAAFQVNRRIRTRNSGGLIYGRISASVYGSVTTITVVNDSGVIDSGISAVSYGFLSYSPSSIPYALYAASGANTDITSLSALVGPGLVPVGAIIDFAASAAPTGYLACPTSATNISRTTYAALFAVLGTTWGAGDGSTTFGMPWFAANYAAVQASGNVGSATTGAVIAHTHGQTSTAAAGGGNMTAKINGAVGSETGDNNPSASTGGAANLAAGVRLLKCVKY